MPEHCRFLPNNGSGARPSTLQKGQFGKSPAERDFLQAVKDLAGYSGWLVYHTLDSRGSDPGFPDLVLVRRGRVVFAELKAERGKPTPMQTRWLAGLAGAGCEVYLWRPSDWPQIEGMLSRG